MLLHHWFVSTGRALPWTLWVLLSSYSEIEICIHAAGQKYLANRSSPIKLSCYKTPTIPSVRVTVWWWQLTSLGESLTYCIRKTVLACGGSFVSL